MILIDTFIHRQFDHVFRLIGNQNQKLRTPKVIFYLLSSGTLKTNYMKAMEFKNRKWYRVKLSNH